MYTPTTITPNSIPIYFPWIIMAPVILTVAALSGCIYDRRTKKFTSHFFNRNSSKSKKSPNASEEPQHLLVSIPSSSLLDEDQMKMVFDGERQKLLNRNSLPPATPSVTEMLHSSSAGHGSSSMLSRHDSLVKNIGAPTASIKRNAAAPDQGEQVNPELLLQLLHNQFHYNNVDLHASAAYPSTNVLGSLSPAYSTPVTSPSDIQSPAQSSRRQRSFMNGGFPISDIRSKSSLILPDKTSLIRANFEIPGIPKPIPNVSSIEYGARQLMAEWDHLYDSVVSNCHPSFTDSAISSSSYQCIGMIGSELMEFIRRSTCRHAGEQIWCPLIYAHHPEYVDLPKVKLLQPGEMFLAMYELLLDGQHTEEIKAALSSIISPCVNKIRSIIMKKNFSSNLNVNVDDLNIFSQNLPWQTMTTVIRAKRYRSSLSFFEVSGTGQRPDSNWMTILNFGMSGRLDLNHSQGSAPSFQSMVDSAFDADLDPFSVVSLPVWPGILDLDESVVRIRARVLISS